MLKEKIKAELKVKYPGLSEIWLAFFAEKLQTKCTTEADIPGQIDELENGIFKPTDVATYAKSETDRRVGEGVTAAEQNLRKKYKFEPLETPAPDPANPNPKAPIDPNETPLMKQMRERLELLEKNASKQGFTDKLTAFLTEKKIPTFIAKGKTFETQEEFDAACLEMEADWTAYEQGKINTNLKEHPKPPGSEGYVGNVDADIAAWAKQNEGTPVIGAAGNA